MLREDYPLRRGRAALGRRIGSRGLLGPRRIQPGDLLTGLALLFGRLVALLAVLAAAWMIVPPLLDASRDAVHDALTADPIRMPEPVPGSRTLKRPLLTIVAVDDSSSTYESDPSELRHDAIRALGRWMTKHARPHDRAAVIRFAATATASELLVPSKLSAGARALAPQPSEGEYTYVAPVVARARRLAAHGHDAARLAIVITDGETPDAVASLAQLKKITDRIVIVALDRDDTWDSNASSWKSSDVTIHEIDNRPMEIAAALAAAVMQTTGEEKR